MTSAVHPREAEVLAAPDGFMIRVFSSHEWTEYRVGPRAAVALAFLEKLRERQARALIYATRVLPHGESVAYASPEYLEQRSQS